MGGDLNIGGSDLQGEKKYVDGGKIVTIVIVLHSGKRNRLIDVWIDR